MTYDPHPRRGTGVLLLIQLVGLVASVAAMVAGVVTR